MGANIPADVSFKMDASRLSNGITWLGGEPFRGEVAQILVRTKRLLGFHPYPAHIFRKTALKVLLDQALTQCQMIQ